jgi:hypothetical protein
MGTGHHLGYVACKGGHDVVTLRSQRQLQQKSYVSLRSSCSLLANPPPKSPLGYLAQALVGTLQIFSSGAHPSCVRSAVVCQQPCNLLLKQVPTQAMRQEALAWEALQGSTSGKNASSFELPPPPLWVFCSASSAGSSGQEGTHGSCPPALVVN